VLIPTVVVVRATQTLDSLYDLADAVVPAEIGCGMLVKSLEQFLLGEEPADQFSAAKQSVLREYLPTSAS
jgi:hypothetical protein